MTTVYHGFRLNPKQGTASDVVVTASERDAWGKSSTRILSPDASLAVADHSPTGFNWGYKGSGPHQLALALALDATGDEFYAAENSWRILQDVQHFQDSWWWNPECLQGRGTDDAE